MPNPMDAMPVGSLVTAKENPVSNVSNSFSTRVEGAVKVTHSDMQRGRQTIRVARISQEGQEEKLVPVPGTFYAELFNPVPAA